MVSFASDPVLQRIQELREGGATAPQFLPGDPGGDARSAVMLLPEMEPSYETLYDTIDGAPLRVPINDVTYQMAKIQVAVNGEEIVPAFSRTPLVQAAVTSRVAPTGNRKGRRRRGRRGRGKS